MANRRRPFFRPPQLLHDAEIQLARQAVSDGARTLRENPVPDMFLGRKTQEPFPEEDQADTAEPDHDPQGVRKPRE